MLISKIAATLMLMLSCCCFRPDDTPPLVQVIGPGVTRLRSAEIDAIFRGAKFSCELDPVTVTRDCQVFEANGTYRHFVTDPAPGMLEGHYTTSDDRLDIILGDSARSYVFYRDKQGRIYRHQGEIADRSLAYLPLRSAHIAR